MTVVYCICAVNSYIRHQSSNRLNVIPLDRILEHLQARFAFCTALFLVTALQVYSVINIVALQTQN